MHWSKSRHKKYRSCPRQFFYEEIAAPRNPKLRALSQAKTPALIRHDVVRQVLNTIVQIPDWTPDDLAGILSEQTDVRSGNLYHRS